MFTRETSPVRIAASASKYSRAGGHHYAASHISAAIFITRLLPGIVLFIMLIMNLGEALPPAGAAEVKKPTPAQLQKILSDFDRYAEAAREYWQVPGMAIAVVVDDKVVFAKGYGVTKVGAADKVDERTIFQIGSTTKAFTAALTAMLVDGKKLDWPDRVVEHLPQFQMFDPWVTRQFEVADLMAQHTGLPPTPGTTRPSWGLTGPT